MNEREMNEGELSNASNAVRYEGRVREAVERHVPPSLSGESARITSLFVNLLVNGLPRDVMAYYANVPPPPVDRRVEELRDQLQRAEEGARRADERERTWRNLLTEVTRSMVGDVTIEMGEENFRKVPGWRLYVSATVGVPAAAASEAAAVRPEWQERLVRAATMKMAERMREMLSRPPELPVTVVAEWQEPEEERPEPPAEGVDEPPPVRPAIIPSSSSA